MFQVTSFPNISFIHLQMDQQYAGLVTWNSTNQSMIAMYPEADNYWQYCPALVQVNHFRPQFHVLL